MVFSKSKSFCFIKLQKVLKSGRGLIRSIQNFVYHNLIKSEVVIHKSNYLQQTTIIYTKLAYLPHSHPVSTTYLFNLFKPKDTISYLNYLFIYGNYLFSLYLFLIYLFAI